MNGTLFPSRSPSPSPIPSSWRGYSSHRHHDARRHRGGAGRRSRWGHNDERHDDSHVGERDDGACPRSIVHGSLRRRTDVELLQEIEEPDADMVAPYSLGRLSLEEGSSATSTSNASMEVTAAGTRSRSLSDLSGRAVINSNNAPQCEAPTSSEPARTTTTSREMISPSTSSLSLSSTPSVMASATSTSSKMYLRSIQYRLERKKSRSGSVNDNNSESHREPMSSLELPPCIPRLAGVRETLSGPVSPASNDWNALRRQRRMLEQCYPLHREHINNNNAAAAIEVGQRRSKKTKSKRDKTERRFLRRSRKAEACASSRTDAASSSDSVGLVVESDTTTTLNAILPTESTDSRASGTPTTAKAKENFAPLASPSAKDCGISLLHAMQQQPASPFPPSPAAGMSLPPRPLGALGSRRASRTPPETAHTPSSYKLHRSRSASPRRHDESSSFHGTDTHLKSAHSSSRRDPDVKNVPQVHRSRSESPSALSRLSMPLPPSRVTAAASPVASRTYREVNAGSPASSSPTSTRLPRPPRSPAATSSDKARQVARQHPGRVETIQVDRSEAATNSRTRSIGPCMPSPSSVATNVFSMGAGAISQCIAPSLLNVDYRVTLVEGRPYESRSIAAAPAPFFLPGVPSTSQQSRLDNSDSPSQSSRDNSSSRPSSASLELKRASNTREELVKLKNELQSKKKEKQQRDASSQHRQTPRSVYDIDTYEARKQRELQVLHGRRACEKRVRFSKPLVTSIRHRPYTKAEDIDKLYFGEDELEELELDRATVDGDQFELALIDDELSAAGSALDVNPQQEKDRHLSTRTSRRDDRDAATVAVTYTNKRVLHHRLEEGGDEVPFSPSDDTSFTYYE